MSETVSRHCDFLVAKKREYHKCGERIPNDEPTEFTVDDDVYTGDLCARHRLELSTVLAPFIDISKATVRVQIGKSVRNVFVHYNGDRFVTADARQWLLENDYEVGLAGSIREELIEEYKAAYQAANS